MSHYMSEVPGVVTPVAITFDHVFSHKETNHVLSLLAWPLLDRLSESGWTAAGLHLADCISIGDFPALCHYDPDVRDLCAADQYIIRQVLAFFGKRQDFDLGVDQELAAWEKFQAAEERCKIANSKFRRWSQGSFRFSQDVEGVLHASSRKISRWMKDAPAIADVQGRFGPGATTQTPKKNACNLMKLVSMPACSANLEHAVSNNSLGLGHWFQAYKQTGNEDGDHGMQRFHSSHAFEAWNLLLPVHSSKLGFVNKNALIHRATCTEAALNGYLQLGVGEEVAGRLKTATGIDLQDQSANQRAAMYGSISGESATADFSSASDLNARLMVSHLWSQGWCDLFDLTRSAQMYDSRTGHITLEKLSSMGNGFTFPVMTTTFLAIAQSCVELVCPESRIRTLVYGDDVVIDVKAWPLFRLVMEELGHAPNVQKTFSDGSFRESCGADYVLGTNVRPVFVKDLLGGSDLFRMHNFFVGRGDFQLAKICEKCILPSIRLRGPSGYGDGHLHTHAYVARRCRGGGAKDPRDWAGYTFKTWGHKPKALKESIQKAFIDNWDNDKRRPGYLEVPCVNGAKRRSVPIYREKHFAIIKTLALYEQYRRGIDSSRTRSTGSWFTRSPHFHEGAVEQIRSMYNPGKGDMDCFTVSGKGPVRLMKVYTFEPPLMAHN